MSEKLNMSDKNEQWKAILCTALAKFAEMDLFVPYIYTAIVQNVIFIK
jgi:hypothetical protein